MCATAPIGGLTDCPAGPLSVPWAEEASLEEYSSVTECLYAQLNITTTDSGELPLLHAC